MGHPEGFCGYGSPDPAPVLPLHALARFLLEELAWLGANLPSSPPGVLAATSPARPSCAPSSRDLSFKRGAGHPLHYPPRDSEIRSHELKGPSAARKSDTVQGWWETCTESEGSYHLQGDTGKLVESKRRGRGVVRVRVWSPSRYDRQSPSDPAPSFPRGSPLAPSSPRPPQRARHSGTVRSPPFEWDRTPT